MNSPSFNKSAVYGREVASFKKIPEKAAVQSSIPVRVMSPKSLKSPGSKSSSSLLLVKGVRGIHKLQKKQVNESAKNLKASSIPKRYANKVHHKKHQAEVKSESSPKSKKLSPKVKKLINHSLNKHQHEKQSLLKQSQELELQQNNKKLHLQRTNEIIRKRNAKQPKKTKQGLHKIPWGVDQRQFEPHENEFSNTVRNKVRSERLKAIRSGRARIGLDAFKKKKHKKERSPPQELPKSSHRESNPLLKSYMEIKKKQLRMKMISDKLEEILKENERERALYELSRKSKDSVVKKSKRKSSSRTQISQVAKVIKNSWENSKEIVTEIELTSPREDLNPRSDHSDEVFLTQEIATNSDIVEHFRRILNEKHENFDLKLELNTEAALAKNIESPQNTSVPEEINSKQYVSVKKDVLIPRLDLHTIPPMQDSSDSSDNQSSQKSQKEGSLSESLDDSEFEKCEDSEEESLVSNKPEPLGSLQAEVDFVLNKELESHLSVLSFKERLPEVDASISLIEQLLSSLLEELLDHENEVLDVINSPLNPDLLHKLYLIENADIGGLLKVPTLDMILNSSSIDAVKTAFNQENLHSREIYLKMLCECVNEALNYLRPYGTQGVPPPWSRRTLKAIGENSLEVLVYRVQNSMKKWACIRAGDDENVSKMLCMDIKDHEDVWLDFEDEELQVNFDVSDLILDVMIEEIINVAFQ